MSTRVQSTQLPFYKLEGTVFWSTTMYNLQNDLLRIKVKLAEEAFQESDAACADLENAMREIQAVTSNKKVLAITDKALCGND